MILSKDLQEILEGVHYFLSEALSHEPLTGKVECLRRGLVLQLEALALSYPTLRIRARSSVSLPYLAMDQGPTHMMHRLSESLSSASSGTNSYSNSSSGDGLVLGSGRGVCDDQQLPPGNHITQDEEYEDFQDSKETKPPDPNGVMKELDVTQDDLDDNEDVYMETLDAVGFSNIIASCDKHGVLSKKTKGLLRNLKNYHCVAANGMLYLYLKESDERQRKTIDLTGYVARIATGEDIRDQRKRDSAFEIVGPGKKTHTFVARTPRDRTEWLAALGRTIRTGRSRTLPSMSSLSGLFGGSIPADVNDIILPPKAPPPPLPTSSAQIIQRQNDKLGEDDFYYHDVADDEKEEVYEVVGPEGTVFGKPVGTSEMLPSRPSSQLPCHVVDLPDYDLVSPEDPPPPPLPECPPPSTPNFSKRPPERPPLPVSLQNRVNKQAARPLPDAPKDTNYNSYDPGGIYCEIEEDLLEAGHEGFMKEFAGEYKNISEYSSNSTNNSVNQESKKPRAVSADGLPQDAGSLSPTLSSRASTNSLVGSFSDEILMNISDPNLSQLSPHKYPLRSLSSYRTPPKLPPKGVPLPPVDDDDSEYKVPVSTMMDTEYQIPPNPIPTEVEGDETIHEISAPITAASELYQVPPSQTIVSIKPKDSDRRKSIIEEQTKPLSSFFNEKEDTNSKNNLKALAKRFEVNDSRVGEDSKESKISNQGTSVKDMIARINKNKALAEKDSNTKGKEESIHSGTTANSQPNGNSTKVGTSHKSNPSEVKLVKPNLPPRPQNLLNGATITNKKSLPAEDDKRSSTVAENAEESDDDYYETPEDNSFDSTSQQDLNGIPNKDTAAPWRVKPEPSATAESTMTGEWYVAKFAFVATIDQAISFNRGDLVLVHETAGNSGWWKATAKGRSGVVPKEYLKKKES